MSDYVKTDDTVYFTANFYHPISGYSATPTATPTWRVYENTTTTKILEGTMTARTDMIGSYIGSFTASLGNGFDPGGFYDVQVSGLVSGISALATVKQFVVDDIYNANIVQVSGNYVSIEDFQGGASSLTAADIADAVWDEPLGDHVAADSTGDALNTASGNLISGGWGDATAANQTTIIGYVDTMETDLQTYGDTNWATADVSAIGASGDIAQAVWEYTTRALSTQDWSTHSASDVLTLIGSSGDIAQTTWEYTTRSLSTQDWSTHSAADVWAVGTRQLTGSQTFNLTGNITGTIDTVTDVTNIVDANVVQVSGNYVSIEDFQGAASSLTTADIADAVWDEALGDHINAGSTGDALNNASGNLISGDWGDATAANQTTIINYVDTMEADLKSYIGSSGDIAQHAWEYTTRALTGIPDVNVVQVSGEYVSIEDFQGAASLTAGQVADAVWDETLGDHQTIGSAGYALNVASGTSGGVTAQQVWEYSTGAGRTLSSLPSGAIADAVWDEQINTHQVFGTAARALMAASGNILTEIIDANIVQISGQNATLNEYIPANIVQVSGNYVSIEDFQGTTSLTAGAVADAVWDEAIGDHQTLTSTGYALNVASGISGGATAAQVWAYTPRALTEPVCSSGAFDANIVSVSGSPVGLQDIAEFNVDLYFAQVKHINDINNARDEFAVQWFKNDQPVTSGDLTSPYISVYSTDDGSTLVNNQPMTYASPLLGVVRYNSASIVLTSGEPYLVETSGVIDSSVRIWKNLIGVDLL